MTAALTFVLFVRLSSYLTLFGAEESQSFKIATRVATFALVYGVVLAHRLRGRRIFRVAVRNDLLLWLYVAFLALGCVSLLYSSNFDHSMLQLVAYAESFCFACVFCRAVARMGALDRLPFAFFGAVALLVAVCLAGAKLDEALFFKVTHEQTIQRLGGTVINANVLGMLAALGTAMGLHLLVEQRVSWRSPLVLGGLGLNLIGLVMASSRSGTIAFALVVLVFARQSRSHVIKWGVLAVAGVGLAQFGQEIMLKQGDRGEVLSLTGRLPFWGDLLSMAFPQRPLLGFGFQRIWYEETFRSIHSYEANMAHNTFLQVLLGLGLVGLIVAVLQVALTVRSVLRIREEGSRLFFVGLLVPLLTNSMTEFGIFGLMNHAVTLYQLLVLLLVFRSAR